MWCSRVVATASLSKVRFFHYRNFRYLPCRCDLRDVCKSPKVRREESTLFQDMRRSLLKLVSNSQPLFRALDISSKSFHKYDRPPPGRYFIPAQPTEVLLLLNTVRNISNLSSKPSLSIWRRKKEIGKEGLIVAKDLKRLCNNPTRLDQYMRSNVSRLLKSDLVSVLFEFQRQDHVFLCMKLYEMVRKEVWYRPDMFFYRDMLIFLARNKKVDEANKVWADLKREEVLFDQHTFGDIMRVYLDSGLPDQAMDVYQEMRSSPEPPLSLPFRVILKGLVPYPELRENVKDDFLDLFPGMIVFDPPEDLFGDRQELSTSSDDEYHSD